jgi:hypothetical protein
MLFTSVLVESCSRLNTRPVFVVLAETMSEQEQLYNADLLRKTAVHL